jgi:hypothetical protein
MRTYRYHPSLDLDSSEEDLRPGESVNVYVGDAIVRGTVTALNGNHVALQLDDGRFLVTTRSNVMSSRMY